jgi:hypothetical protein
MVVVVPSTYKSPLILIDPVSSPIAAGSITISEGPVMVLVLIPIPFTPPTCTVEVFLLKVKFEEAPETPSSLKMTSVSDPAIGPIRPCVP